MAACAILLEMAQIDGEFDEKEREDIFSFMKKDFQLPDEYVSELMEISGKELDGSTDLWRFANMINQTYSPEEKFLVMEMIWKVVYADGALDKHEDYLAHKLANLLRLPHKEMINAKLKALGKSR